MKLESYEVGKPFPSPVPDQEGATMELWKAGLTILIQMPGLTKGETQAFKTSFQQYSYFESKTPVQIAVWVFDFPKPFGQIDVNFNAKIVSPEYINSYLEVENGQIKNLLTFFLLDGQILRGIKAFGLEPEAVKLFHSTIRQQIIAEYAPSDYNRYLAAIYNCSSQEIFDMGRIFSSSMP